MQRKFVRGSGKRLWGMHLLQAALLVLALSLLTGCLGSERLIERLRPIRSADDAIRRIQDRMETEMRRRDIPGMAVALIVDSEVIWQENLGWADLENRVPLTDETIFRAGSIAKLCTALEIMRMAEEGLVDLDAPIETYLPDFTIQRDFLPDEPITIRSLLCHRSGLPRNGTLPLWYWDPGVAVLREQVASLGDTHAAYPPWTWYKYSNIGYVVLGRIIEVARGGFWPDVMQREILAPLGVTSSAFLSERLSRSRTIATGYFRVERRNVPGQAYDIITMPSGNLYATVSDLAQLVKLVLRAGTAEDGPFVRPETLQEMFDPKYASENDPQTNGLGWFTDETYLGERVVFHSGTNEGTISILAVLPDSKLGIVAVATSQEFEEIQNEFAFEALDWLRQGIHGVKRKPEAQPEKADVWTPGTRLAGTYIVESERMVVDSRKDRWVAEVMGLNVRLVPLDTGDFRAKHWLLPFGDVRMRFTDATPADAIVTLGGSYHIYAPRYPIDESPPPFWRELVGVYGVEPRLRSRYSDADLLWTTRIELEEGILWMPDEGKYLIPIDETRIRIVGGIFDGETMDRDPATGTIEWAGFRYVPRRSEG